MGAGHTGRAGRVRAAAGLIPRGEFSLAIAGFGVTAGLPQRLASVTVAYVLILAVLGPVLARIADHLATASRRSALEET
jgi:CPA2 family monovalent cation:H+ antiporter-2